MPAETATLCSERISQSGSTSTSRTRRKKAIEAAAGYYEENLKMFGPLRLVRALSDEQINAMSDPSRAPTADLPRIEDAVSTGGFLAGPPEVIIEQLKKLEAAYPGLDRVGVSHPSARRRP